MRKLLVFLLVAALLACAAPGMGEQVAMRIVACPEQNFSTLCNPEYDYSYTPDGGLTLELDPGGEDAFVTIFKTDAPGADFNAEYYLNNVYANMLKSSYGGELSSLSRCTTYNLGGRQLPSVMAIYRANGKGRMRFCAYDLREDCFVRYEAFSRQEDVEMEKALKALAVAVGNFQPDANYYSKSK